MNKFWKKIIYKKNTHSFLLQLISAFLGFAGFLILARFLNRDAFGHWVIYITAYGFIDVLRGGLTIQGVVRFLSAANDNESKKLLGSNWVINTLIAVILSVVVLSLRFIFNEAITQSDYHYFFIYYPILVIVSISSFNSQAYLQASLQFDKMLFIRSFEAGFFTLFILFCYIFNFQSIETVIVAQIIIYALSSIICIVKGWDGSKYIINTDKQTVKQIFRFGKYSSATFVGAHLLRSADTFIIGLSTVLGAQAVAVFSIPLKAVEVLEIPLRSLSQTFYPLMSKLSIENKMNEFRQQFYVHSGALTLLFVPILIAGFFLAEEIMVIVGGAEYIEAANIFRVFIFISLIIPVDRFSGIALDSLNRPDLNFYKIILMVTFNIIGDVIAVFYFNSVLLVAFATLLFLLVGALAGLFFTKKTAGIEIKRILPEGIAFYSKLLKKYMYK